MGPGTVGVFRKSVYVNRAGVARHSCVGWLRGVVVEETNRTSGTRDEPPSSLAPLVIVCGIAVSAKRATKQSLCLPPVVATDDAIRFVSSLKMLSPSGPTWNLRPAALGVARRFSCRATARGMAFPTATRRRLQREEVADIVGIRKLYHSATATIPV